MESNVQVHPLYTEMTDIWQTDLDCYDGEEVIKAASTRYLPMTSGQLEDGAASSENSLGFRAYQAYKTRAVFPDIFREAVEACIGILHRNPPTIELPAVMEGMVDNCSLLGESIEVFLRRVNTAQLTTGRIGVMGDVRTGRDGNIRPVLLTYTEKNVVNWNDTIDDYDGIDLSLVVLDESANKLQPDLSWEYEKSYRVLLMGTLDESSGSVTFPGDTYLTATTDTLDNLIGLDYKAPEVRGTPSDQIPFVFINSKDLSPSPDMPPLHGLANICLAIYRGEADYRQNLFMQGQDTLVTVGIIGDEDDVVRTGAGAVIKAPLNGDAKYIGVSSQGLPEQRTSLENDYAKAARKGGQLIDSTSRSKESGEALKIRVAAQTATLPQIAKTAAAGVEKVLKALAVWIGANPDEVVVTPNLEFTDADLNGQTLVQIIDAKVKGAPISDESIHQWCVENNLTKKTYEEELTAIENEEPKI